MKRTKRLRQILLGSFLLLSCLLVAFVLDRYQESASSSRVEPPPQPEADLTIEKFHYSESRDGKPLWELSAETADHDLATGVTRVRQVTAVFFAQDGRGDLVLTADRGRWQEDRRELRIDSDVRLESAEGYVCYADQLVFAEAESQLRSSGPVRLVAKQFELRGVGLEIDLIEKTLHLMADVWSSWNIREMLKERG